MELLRSEWCRLLVLCNGLGRRSGKKKWFGSTSGTRNCDEYTISALAIISTVPTNSLTGEHSRFFRRDDALLLSGDTVIVIAIVVAADVLEMSPKLPVIWFV